mmetsp:Transcript_43437/g.44133  ORF Transcript_43437/g.44133 Transcript_43437/m.44133 type:complete len:248 (+) Transcript_43437:26-769(+)
MQFRVVIPDEGAEAGQIVRIHLEDGTEANVKIPNGLSSGDSFIFEVPTHQMVNFYFFTDFSTSLSSSSSQAQSHYQSTTTTKSTSASASTPIGGDNITGVPTTQINNINKSKAKTLLTATASLVVDGDDDDDSDGDSDSDSDGDGDANNASNSQQQQDQRRQNPTFLKREIIDYRDFIFALSVGLLIGSSIVLGFLLGILHVTAPYPIDGHGNLLGNISDSNNSNDDNNTLMNTNFPATPKGPEDAI